MNANLFFQEGVFCCQITLQETSRQWIRREVFNLS